VATKENMHVLDMEQRIIVIAILWVQELEELLQQFSFEI
jgi:hypothetical protein